MGIKETLKKKRTILNLIIWFFSLCALALIAGVACYKCLKNFYENQFIDATLMGYFVVICLVLVGTFCEEEFQKKTLLVLCFLGAIMYFVSSVLLFMFLNDTYFGSRGELDDVKGRTMGGTVVALFVGLLYLLEFVVDLAKPEVFK